MRKYYTKAEDDIIRKYYPITTPQVVLKHLPGRTLAALRSRTQHLGVTSESTRWSSKEDTYLTANYAWTSWKTLIKKLHRTKSTITAHANNLGLFKEDRINSRWKKAEVAYIKKNYATTKNSILMKKFKKSLAAVTSLAYRHGWHKQHVTKTMYKKWTAADDLFINTNFGTMSIIDISHHVHKCVAATYHRLHKLGLINKTSVTKSLLEADFQKFLIDNNISFVAQFPLRRYRCDFKIGDVLIELNGTFWHADSRVYPKPVYKAQKERVRCDKVKKKLIIEAGYKLATIWELDFRNDRDRVLSDLQAVLNGDIEDYDSAKSVEISSR